MFSYIYLPNVTPPSKGISAPVIYELPLLLRNKDVAIISPSFPDLPWGVDLPADSKKVSSPTIKFVILLGKGPGEIVLTLIKSFANSLAKTLVK